MRTRWLLRKLLPRGKNGKNGKGHGVGSGAMPPPPAYSRQRKEREIDMIRRAKALGVKMTDSEIRAAVSSMPVDMHGRVTPKAYQRWLLEVTQPAKERQALLEFVGKVDEKKSVQVLFSVIDVIGTSLYAALGTIYAGEAGMHVLGATLVGCVSGMGGGTLNNLMMGKTPVFWMEHPRYMLMCILASIPTFYLWPWLQEELIKRETPKMQPDEQGHITFRHFQEWLRHGGSLSKQLEAHVQNELDLRGKPTDAQVFQWMDCDHKGFIAPEDLQILSRLSSIDSPVLYAVNSACLCMFAVSGAQSGIHRGMHPLVCTVAGVTICFGGIIRDLLCQRDVAVGAESFAVSTGLGAGTYVALRELVLRGIALPVELRIGATCAVVLGVQWVAWAIRPSPLLPPMRAANLDWEEWRRRGFLMK